MSQTNAEKYNEHHQKSLEDLSLNLSGAPLNSPDALLMRIVYEQKTIEKQDEFNKKQIKLQHDFNQELLTRQIEANKKIVKITVIATLGAAILGAIIGGYAQSYFQQQIQKPPQQTSQPQTTMQKPASGSGKINDKAASHPSK